jgi:hypothetical protein
VSDEQSDLDKEIRTAFSSTYGDGLTLVVHFEPEEARDVLARAEFDGETPIDWLHRVALERSRETGWVRIYS